MSDLWDQFRVPCGTDLRLAGFVPIANRVSPERFVPRQGQAGAKPLSSPTVVLIQNQQCPAQRPSA